MQLPQLTLWLVVTFNCTDDVIDKASGSTDKSSIEFSNLKTDLNVQDIWRFHNPKEREYSYIDPSGRGHNSRIDY